MNYAECKQSAVLAGVVAGLLMLVSGLTYRVLASPGNKTPIDPAALEGFPMQIGEWRGQEVPLDAVIAQATCADAIINRRYVRRNGSQIVSFYMACGVNVHGLLGHRPMSCYSGAGWTLMKSHSVELALKDGYRLPCQVFRFLRGGLDVQQVAVLNYFIMDGQFTGAIQLRPKSWYRFTGVDYSGQVQIVTSSQSLNSDLMESLVSDFAVESAPSVTRLIANIEQVRNETKAANLPEEK